MMCTGLSSYSYMTNVIKMPFDDGQRNERRVKIIRLMNMKSRDSENELIRIFRFFSGGVALVFMLLQVAPGPLGRIDPAGRRAMFLFSLTYGVIFIYLIVPGLQGLMKSFYLPPVLIAASVIPIAIINAKYRQLMSTGGPLTPWTTP
jgi:hypothetical protein